MRALNHSWIGLTLLALTLSVVLLGMRGIWDPDEGRYTSIALNMLDSGDWLVPQRSPETAHWAKPPLTYWAIAASMAVFGRNAWAARLPAALSYLLCVWLCLQLARRLLPAGAARDAPWLYATMALNIGAAQFISTDYLLSACETLAMTGYMQARFGATHARYWLAVFWGALGLAFLAKGPPGLLPLAAVLACEGLLPDRRRPSLLQWWTLPLFALIALPWYLVVVVQTPGLLAHLFGREVVARIATEDLDRHGQWYGWLLIYVPTLLVGALPWTGDVTRWARALPARARRWRDVHVREREAAQVLLALWFLLPLLVFCLSRSRMPLYLLPLFVPLALLVALERQRRGANTLPVAGIAIWVLLMLALQFGVARWSTHKNADAWADAIRSRSGRAIAHVVFVEDMARYGLHLQLGATVEKVSLQPQRNARFDPEYDADIAALLPARATMDTVWIAKRARFDATAVRLRVLGWRPVALGAPYQDRIIFRLQPRPAPNAADPD